MSDLRTAAQQALEALTAHADLHSTMYLKMDAIAALKAALVEDAMQKFTDVNQELEAALAEPVQEPVAKVELMTTGGNAGLATRIVEIDDHLRERLRPGQLLYTAPPQRKPLTEEAIYRLFVRSGLGAYHQKDFVVQTEYDRRVEAFARAIERAHGITGEAA